MSFLYDVYGNRKYLTAAERLAFLDGAKTLSKESESFCRVLAYTGGRISEILALTPTRIDLEGRVIILESLKKRRSGMFRAIPVPVALLRELNRIHDIRSAQTDATRRHAPIWRFGRTTAWTSVKQAMTTAAIEGPRACPKGLRHSFAVAALQGGVPITLVRKWLGHSHISTTEIYTDVVGDEEQHLAARLWRVFENPPRKFEPSDTAA